MKNIKSYNESLVDASNQKELNNELFNSIFNGNVDDVKSLLDMGAQVNAIYSYRMRPLHVSVEKKNIKMIKLLIDRGAKVNLKDRDGNTALNYLTRIINSPDIEIIKLLLDSGADPNIEENIGKNTPLHNVVKSEIAEVLIDRGDKINAQNIRGNTPLHHVALRFSGVNTNVMNLIKLLIDRGADANITNNSGHTPPQIILNEPNKKEIVKFFISNGVDPLDIFKDIDQILSYFDKDIDWMPESDTKRRLLLAKRSKKMFGV